jgi:nucleoside-diphosphate-sugar epimerase
MELVVLRPVLVYGAQAPGNFARMLRAVSRGLPLPLAGIDNRRSLLAVENLTDLIEVCIRHPQAANQVFLAADGDDVSTPELLRAIGDAIGKPARLFRLPPRLLRLAARLAGKQAEFDRLCGSLRVDIGKARERLDWNPPLTLEQALRQLSRE